MRKLILAAAFAALSVPSFAPLAFAQSASAQSVDAVVAANKAAMGGAAWDGKQTMTADWTYAGQAMTGTVHSVSDLETPRFADSYTIGPANGANGFDGQRAWNHDPSGQVSYQDGADQKQIAISEAYRRSNALWQPNYGGAQVATINGTREGRSYDVITVTPKDGNPFEMWIDAETHLLTRIVEKQGADTSITTLSDYRTTEGVQVAHKIHVTTGDAKYDTDLTLTKVAFGPGQPETAYAIPAVTKIDFSIAGGAHQTTVPFVLINNHIYVDVRLNGRGPYRLLLDTGGVAIITPTVQRELGLEAQGKMEGSGAGEARVDVSLTKVSELRIGDAVIKDQVFAVFPLESFADVEGVPQNGIIGYEVFRRFITRIDYARGELTLIDRRHFDPSKAGGVVPFAFNEHVPMVKGEIDGLAGEFQIDTGARSELVLTEPFATAHGLRAAHRRGVEAISGWGVGGPSRGYVTRMGLLKIGGIKFDAPVTTFSAASRGAFGQASFAGNIGSGLLKRYIVTFDYENQKMYLAPGGIAERDGFDRAGMWINRSPQGFRVIGVTAGSPVAEAGIKQDDIIVSVDGKRASDIALPDIRRWLRTRPPGTVFHFGVMRGETTQDFGVTLRDMI